MGLMKKLEGIFSAAAFAEAGEAETARAILNEDLPGGAGADRSGTEDQLRDARRLSGQAGGTTAQEA